MNIKNFYDWRLNVHKPSSIPSGFIYHMGSTIEHEEYQKLKKDLLRLYPDLRKFFELLEVKIGANFTFRDASKLIFKEGDLCRGFPLIKRLCIGFLCPDNEWRSLLC